jgi:predicted TIM-barrel fold metal-dependent hydrolase
MNRAVRDLAVELTRRDIEELVEALPVICRAADVAAVTGWSQSTVRDDWRVYAAAKDSGDLEGVKGVLPCFFSQGVPDDRSGGRKYRRYRVHRSVFIRWLLDLQVDAHEVDDMLEEVEA